ncbi:MAG: cupin domain-containing protein [Pseudomonadota bacterium]
MKIDLAATLADVTDLWAPKRVATYNDNEVTVVRIKGEFPFHIHDDSDDFFLILKGHVHIDIDGSETQICGPGEMCIIPKGRRHRPRAPEEAEILLIEPLGLRETNDDHRVTARKTA